MIFFKPEETYKLYVDVLEDSAETRLLAKNEDFGIEIYAYDSFGFPRIIVSYEGSPIDNVTVIDPVDICAEVAAIYETYLPEEAQQLKESSTEEPDDPQDAPEEPKDQPCQDYLIAERETELEESAVKFLADILETTEDDVSFNNGDLAADFMEHCLEYLYRKHHIDVYRPMYLEDEQGKVSFAEYPYGEMEFEDPSSLYD